MKSKYIGLVINSFLILECFNKKGKTKYYNAYFKVKCIHCNQIKNIARANLLKNEAKCDCQKQQNYHNTKGESKTKLHHIYRSIIDRCCNNKSWAYKWYGAKGVDICDEWFNDYQKFKRWSIDNGYKEGLSMDRIDASGNYEPSNCEWVTRSENSIRRGKNK